MRINKYDTLIFRCVYKQELSYFEDSSFCYSRCCETDIATGFGHL